MTSCLKLLPPRFLYPGGSYFQTVSQDKPLPTQVTFVKWFVTAFREEKNTLTQGERSTSLQETGLCVLQTGATDGYRQLLALPD